MNALAKLHLAPVAPVTEELTTQELLNRLASNASKPLVFSYEGKDVLPSYHVTEVKSGSFAALDCGAQYETWRETFIQLWDVPEPDRSWMPVWKFLAIIRKVSSQVELGEKLTFEVSDVVEAMALYRASAIHEGSDTVRVELTRRPSSCKPRDRWLEEQQTASACCGPATSQQPCCG